MELFYVLLVLLLATRVLGEVFERMGQPALVGELAAGILIGALAHGFSGALPVLSTIADEPVFIAITDLGMFFLMLSAGVEMRPQDLSRASRGAMVVASAGLLVPLALGFALGWAFLPASEVRLAQALFLGVALAITAVPVSVRVLRDLGLMDTDLGRLVVSAALVDDVLSLVLLAVLTAVVRTGELPDLAAIGLLLAKVAAFFALAVAVGRWVLPPIGRRIRGAHAAEVEFSFLMIVALAFSVLAERLSMHFIIGAFLAGLFFGRRTIADRAYRDVKRKVATITDGFLAPIFFASIGLHLDAGSLGEVPVFVIVLVVAATVGKLAGAGGAARRVGLSQRDAVGVGIAMNARGAVELIVADIALRAGLFTRPEPPPPLVQSLYSAVVVMAVVTTVLTPIAIGWLYRSGSAPSGAGEPEEDTT